MKNIYESRFFQESDPKINKLIFPLPETWWSRFYEYKWALNFVSSNDVILDAACGISHPFKFFLADICHSVYACDIDQRILSKEAIIDDIRNDFGVRESDKINPSYFNRLHLSQCNLTTLPYPDAFFDKVFCISVLEHLPPEDILMTLQEFNRTLKYDGNLILTFDYPTIDLELLTDMIHEAGLMFAGEYSLIKPDDAINNNLWGELYCFRAVLKKTNETQEIFNDEAAENKDIEGYLQKKESFNYKQYWEENYASGGNSGSGSYGLLAEFKAEVINDWIDTHGIRSVIEFGCGDGNQLKYMNYESYLGLDIAQSSISLCNTQFKDDHHKSFLWYQPGYFYNHGFIQADLVVCLDVLYHITDENDFINTLNDVFSCAKKFVILYTKITEYEGSSGIDTIMDRNIFKYLEAQLDYDVKKIVEQRYPDLSSAHFIILQRRENTN